MTKKISWSSSGSIHKILKDNYFNQNYIDTTNNMFGTGIRYQKITDKSYIIDCKLSEIWGKHLVCCLYTSSVYSWSFFYNNSMRFTNFQLIDTTVLPNFNFNIDAKRTY